MDNTVYRNTARVFKYKLELEITKHSENANVDN